MREFLMSVAWSVLAWQVLSLVMNVLLTWKTPEQWEAWVAKHPKGAWGVQLMRQMGWNLPGLIRKSKQLVDMQAGKAPPGAGLLKPLPDALERAMQNPDLARQLEAAAAKMLEAKVG